MAMSVSEPTDTREAAGLPWRIAAIETTGFANL